MATGKILKPAKDPKTPLGIKANRHHHVITNTPSNAHPGETLYVRIPKLAMNTIFVPGSIYLSADVNISGNAGNYVVNNLGRNLIRKLVIKWGPEIIQSIDYYNLFYTFKDLWETKEKRANMIFQGVQSENLRKLRSGVTGTNDSEDKILKLIFSNKYKIPLDFELLTSHSPLYKFAIDEDMVFEITMAPLADVIVSPDIKDWNYNLSNVCLEYDTVTNEGIAKQIENIYMSGYAVHYDYIDHFKTVELRPNENLVNENINFPRSSIKGLLFLFIENKGDGKRDSELFSNPKIDNLKITIEGISNQIFAQNMRMLDQFPECTKYFLTEKMKDITVSNVGVEKYYARNNFGLWIDLRTTEDNSLHGSGRKLQNTKDGIQISFNKDNKEYSMHVFVVSDAQLNIQNCQLVSVQN